MTVPLTIDSTVQDLAVGLVDADGVNIAAPTEEFIQQCRRAVDAVVREEPEGGDQRRQAVRQLLRRGGFKPSGRNKPAQEYLWRAAGPDGDWPSILNVVDALNVVSLRSGLPISLMALNRLQPPFVIRYGRQDESFVFNRAGQTLKLEGLICVCHTVDGVAQPVGTPVKDSQLAKVTAEDTHALACIFAPRSALPDSRLQYWANELAAAFRQWCSPQSVTTSVVSSA
jgi:DNA/RNA-binding domain of Phe-tRNA-synthetase-like protein